MNLLTRTLVFAGLILLFLLTAVAWHSYSQIRILSLPIPQSLAIITLVLPLVIALSTRAAYGLPRTYSAQARPLLYLAIFIIQLIYETIIATLSLTYMGPNCRLEEQWARLYRNKDGNAIRRIQDRFECCGFNTAVDRAWPFPHGRPEDGYGADQCERMHSRNMPCVGPWRQAAQINAGLLFTVAMVVFVVKIITLIFQSTRWMCSFERLSTGNLERALPTNSVDANRLIDEGEQLAADEQYHDEVDGGQEQIAGLENANGNGSRLRVEPSRLGAGDGGEQWREDA